MIKELQQIELQEDFNWVATRMMIFELENFETMTLTKAMSNGLVDRVLKFHESLDNFEICQKIMMYKSKMKDV